MQPATPSVASPVVAAAMTAKESVGEAVACICTETAPPQGSFDTLVIVLVGSGSNKKEFQVHRGLLSYNSITFQYSLRNEANHNIDLLAEDPSIFEMIVYWMYTSRFWTPNVDKDGKIPLELVVLVRIYLFAAAKGMYNLQNATMTLIYQKNMEIWRAPITQVNMIYAHTTEMSPLRRFLVDFVADTWGFNFGLCEGTALPNQFLVDVLVSLRDAGKTPGVGVNNARWVAEMNENFCDAYHDHRK